MMKATAVVLSALFSCPVLAQGALSSDAPQGQASIVRLPTASYPAMALAAHVWGPVELSIAVRPDGTVASVEVIGGPPMLRDAAVESAKQTQFKCAGCAVSEKHFRVVYRYELAEPYYCDPPDKSYPRISQSAGVVTITGQPAGTCDPMGSVERVRVRSAKCLYRWKCGWR
jgi:TonB family protein